MNVYRINSYIKWVLLFVFCILSGCGSKAEYHNEEGLYLYNQRKYDDAITEFKKALDYSPEYYDAHYHLGISYYAKGMIDESITELRKAIDINPDEPKAHYNIAFAYVYKERVNEAILEYQKAIELYAKRKDKKEDQQGF